VTADPWPDALLTRMRAICADLPESYEQPAWVGVRWRIRQQTFAHVLTITEGWPPAYARAAATDGPAHILMVLANGPELEALRHSGHPYFSTPWRRTEVGIHITERSDWIEIAELVTESYCNRAPRRLAALVRNNHQHAEGE
jgi:hypothetical protein